MLDAAIPFYLGCALADKGGKILVARDVRISSEDIEKQLCKGLLMGDCTVWLTGVLPTPALAYIAACERADLAVMITASHNPPEFNGLKVFGKHGRKLSPSEEKALDKKLAALIENENVRANTITEPNEAGLPLPTLAPTGSASLSALSSAAPSTVGKDLSASLCDFCEDDHGSELKLKMINHRVRIAENAELLYAEHVLMSAPRLDGVKVRLDCACGCFAQLAAGIFERLGAIVRVENGVRDGACVNVGCGSTHIDKFLPLVDDDEIGFAFDGDGDRVLAVVNGQIYDGDAILLALASLYRIQGKLRKKFVVGTMLTGSRLEHELAMCGIALLRTDVGDKNVLDALLREGCLLGGEKSGHILMLDRSMTGDGLVTALALLEVKKTFGKLPSYTPYPMIEFNIPASNPFAEFESAAFKNKLHAAERAVGTNGRLIVRPSGTEPYIRVTCECFYDKIIDRDRLIAFFD